MQVYKMFSGIFIFGHNAKDLSHYGCRSPYIIRSYIERVKFSTLHHANWKHYRWMLPFLSISATLANVAGVLYIPMTRAASSKLVPLNEQGILIFGIDYLKIFLFQGDPRCIGYWKAMFNTSAYTQ